MIYRIRSKDRGLIYLRCSTDTQEHSLSKQLSWALAEATKLGVSVAGNTSDLEQMEAGKLHTLKSLRMDKAISGSEMDRPGLNALLRDAANDPGISHVFAFARDRIARPDNPMTGTQIEQQLHTLGISIVFPQFTSVPSNDRMGQLMQGIISQVEYHKSGDFLDGLAQQGIRTQRQLASRGFSVGGRAPYGFVRALMREDTREIVDYPEDGRKITQPGHHVVWVPDPKEDPRSPTSKIQVWLKILSWYKQRWGYKRIANELTRLGIPSPDAGRYRTVQGHRRRNDIAWCYNTVQNLIENPIIAGIYRYGTRSEGKFFRQGPDGPRALTEADMSGSKPKVVKNDPAQVFKIVGHSEAFITPDEHNKVLAIQKTRGHTQRNKPRIRDLNRYPLSCRLIDLTKGCGALMYARTSGNRPVYTCGKYLKGHKAACGHHQVDADAMLKLVLHATRRQISVLGDRNALRNILIKKAQTASSICGTEQLRAQLEMQHQEEKSRLDQLAEKFIRAESELLEKRIKQDIAAGEAKVRALEERLRNLPQQSVNAESIETQVNKALVVFDRLDELVNHPEHRHRVLDLLNKLGVYVGLEFRPEKIGPKRTANRLTAGVICYGSSYENIHKNYVEPQRKLSACGHSNHFGLGNHSTASGVSLLTPPVALLPAGSEDCITKSRRGDRI